MRKWCVFLFVAVFAVLAHPAAGQCPSVIQQAICDADDSTRFAAVLTGDQEPAGGLAGASGTGVFVIDRDRDLLFYRVEVGALANITGAHIHRGDFGEPGPVVITLMPDGTSFVDGVLEGSVSADGALLDEIDSDPSSFFVNVHTPEYPQGAIRGQLNGRGSTLFFGDLAGSGAAGASGAFTFGFVDDDPEADDVRVDFDVMTDDVADFDGATLQEGTGDAAEDIFDLEDADGFTNGRLRGSGRVSRDEMVRILANPSGYHLQFRSPSAGTLSGTLGDAIVTYIPVFGRVVNDHGNVFNSDLRLFNPGTQTVNVFVQFFPAGSTSALAGRTAVIQLDPGEAEEIEDAVRTLFGTDMTVGSLRIVTSGPIIADSEIMDDVTTSNVRTNSHNPHFGQFVSGIASCHGVTQGLLTSLAASQSASGFRTNVLLANPGPRSALARFELRNQQGQLLDSTTRRVGANTQELLRLNGSHGLFPNAGSEIGNAIVTMHADTPLILGGSVIQNSTGEARFTTARDISRPFMLHREPME